MSRWKHVSNLYSITRLHYMGMGLKWPYGDIEEMTHIDAWRTEDGNEEGRTVAYVFRTASGDVGVVYADSIAEKDLLAQESIREAEEELRETAAEANGGAGAAESGDGEDPPPFGVRDVWMRRFPAAAKPT